MVDHRKAWDPENHGYGKHDFQHIDPDTINVDEAARSLRDEEQHFGDVRQYNSAYNEKHPENNLDLDWLGRVNTIFETDAPDYAGIWIVTNQPTVKAPVVYARCVKLESEDDDPEGKDEVVISCVALGSQVNEENEFLQVRSKILKKGSVNRKQRMRLTKKEK